MKNNSNVVVLTGLMLFLISCQKENSKVVPNVKINPVTNVTESSASAGGYIVSEGGVPVTSRGVCWSTNQNPTIADNKTSNGEGSGSFTSTITGLSPGTAYYVRAYAINSIGAGYSSQNSFNTLASKPVISTVNFTNITTTTVSCGGEITSDGGAAITARGVCWSTLHNPVITDSKTNDGTGSGNFTSTISDLNINTTYYVRAYASNSAGTAYGSESSITLYMNVPDTPVTDIDGNVYSTVRIGTQVWMAENLKTTKYRNGDPIPYLTDNNAWETSQSGAYCWYDNNESANKATYGALYNYYSVTDNRKLAPAGFHVPTLGEWWTLITFLGGTNDCGGKIKETGTSHWNSPNDGATNESGFTALPGGTRFLGGSFQSLRFWALWWTTETSGPGNVYGVDVYVNSNHFGGVEFLKRYGLSVRCLKD